MDEFLTDESTYRVRLPIFEGPLDLLLYLVKKNEYDIFDIPIAEITRQYMDHIEIMKVLNLDIAGEYLVMAATLAHIKSRMLLPPDRAEDQEQEELDPRMELALKLAEYERFKDAARQLDEFDILLRDVFLRGGRMVLETEDEKLTDLTLFELVAALQKVLLAAPKETIHQISIGELTIQERMVELSQMILERGEMVFEDLFLEEPSRMAIVLTFLALLELIKDRVVRIYQAQPFGTIRLFRAVTEDA
ncbi:MAG: segregation/condensation protein A [Deltaproteobacteria bacterium]|nr:segregation/condensation protein A [Candidatus Zymogenaceae bacterium]